MAAQKKINVDVLNELIIGRVEPQIYAFTTETIPNYLKVGDTYRPLEVRLNEWKKYFPNLKNKFQDVAKVDDDTFFRDYSIHKFLENELKRSRLEKGTLLNIPHYSNEFFKNVTIKDLKDAIKDIKRGHKINDLKYQYYRFNESRITIDPHYNRIETYEPRPNQKETIENFKRALNKGRKNLLMYAVMRFGKSFTSMCCAVEMGAKIVVVVSAKADVKEEWKRTTESHCKFDGYSFLDSDSLLRNKNIISEKQKLKEKIVLFLTLQELHNKEGKIKQKHLEIFQNKVDLLLIDETHFGARAEEYGKVLREEKLTDKEIKSELKHNEHDFEDIKKTIKVFTAKVRIHLSGTPYRILMNSEFTNEDIIAFYQFSNIADDQEKWNLRVRDINDHRETLGKMEIAEWKNPYYGFPQMIRFAFNPNESSRKKMEEMKKHGVTYAFSELFRPQSLKNDKTNELHKKFKHEKEIHDLLKVIDGTEKDENLLSFLDYDKIKEGQMCRHIVCVLPYCASCDALEALISKNKFKHISNYEIINISGVESEKLYKDTESVKAKIKKFESENKKTITLTVNRMLTGSTVHEWDTMLYLKDTASPQEYDQAIFRLQNQYIKVFKETNGDVVKFNMKPQTLLVDFNPNRMFQMQEHKSQIYNVNIEKNGNSKLEERIRKELEISPIVVLNKYKIVQIEPSEIIDAVREYSSNRSVLDEATSIAVDLSLLKIKAIKAEIEKQGEIGSKQGIQLNGTIGDGDDFDLVGEASEGLDKNGNTSTSKTENNKIDYKGKFAMYYARILFFSFLTDSIVKSLQEIIECIKDDKNNLRIASNLDLNKKILELFQKHINPFVLMELDYKIQNINDLATDTNLPPIQRASNAMKRFSRLSESELVTPEDIAVKMINCLPSKSFSKKSLILDVASKQGEFVYSVYKLTYLKYGKKIANNLYSIPTSKIAYEFTRKVYKLLELDINNVANTYTSFELLKENKIIEKDKLYINNQYMKFDVIVGNPPYQINSSISNKRAEKHWPSFINLSVKILKNDGYLCLITPTSWLSGSKNIVKGSKGVMDLFLENNLLSIYKGFDFPGVGIATHFWLLEKNNNYHKTDIHDISTDESYSINLNSGFYPSDLDPIKTSIIQKVFSKEGFFWVPATSMYTKYRKSATDKKTKGNTIKTYVKGGNFEEVQFAYFTDECIPALNSLSKVVVPLSGAEKFTPYIDIKGIPFCCDSYVLPLTESSDKLTYTYWNGKAFKEKTSSSGTNLYNWNGNLESVKSIFYSKLFKFLIQNYRTSGFVQYPIVKRLPKFDLSKIWNDEQIFDFLGLTKIERNYIIKNI